MKILFHWILKFASLVALIQFGSYSISRTWRRSPSRRRQRFENALCCGFSRSFGLDIGFGLHEGCSVTLVLCWALLHLLLNLRERWDTIDILFFLEKKERIVQGYKSSHNISVKSVKIWMTMTTHCYSKVLCPLMGLWCFSHFCKCLLSKEAAKMSIVSRCGEIAKTSSRYLTFDWNISLSFKSLEF